MDVPTYIVENNLIPSLSSALTYIVEHWVVIILTALSLTAIGVIAYLLVSLMPNLIKSIMLFVDTATTNIPIITQSINSLINNVEKMNSTLTALLSIQTRVDNMETKVLNKLDELVTKHNETHNLINVILSKV
jgi:predicted PurR-regulated permease PerM